MSELGVFIFFLILRKMLIVLFGEERGCYEGELKFNEI